MKGLYHENDASLYDHLQYMYSRNIYPDTQSWKYNESEAQAKQNGGDHVLAMRGIWSIHIAMPDEREWFRPWTTAKITLVN